MGTCYQLLALDVKRSLDLDKFYNRHSAYAALIDTAPWGSRGCYEVTPAVLRRAAEEAGRAAPSSDEDADDIAYGAEKLLRAAVWMERVGSAVAYLVDDTSDWEEHMFPLSAAEERTMTPERVWDHFYAYRDWPFDHPDDEVLAARGEG